MFNWFKPSKKCNKSAIQKFSAQRRMANSGIPPKGIPPKKQTSSGRSTNAKDTTNLISKCSKLLSAFKETIIFFSPYIATAKAAPFEYFKDRIFFRTSTSEDVHVLQSRDTDLSFVRKMINENLCGISYASEGIVGEKIIDFCRRVTDEFSGSNLFISAVNDSPKVLNEGLECLVAHLDDKCNGSPEAREFYPYLIGIPIILAIGIFAAHLNKRFNTDCVECYDYDPIPDIEDEERAERIAPSP